MKSESDMAEAAAGGANAAGAGEIPTARASARSVRALPLLPALLLLLLILGYAGRNAGASIADAGVAPASSPVAAADSGGKKPDSTNVDGEKGATVGQMPLRRADSTWKTTNLYIEAIGDTTGRDVNREVVTALRSGNHYRGRDSSFVFEGDGCIQITLYLGATAAVPDTVRWVNSCAGNNPCLDTVSVPLGCWTRQVITQDGAPVLVCDTVCLLEQYVEFHTLRLTRQDLFNLAYWQLVTYGNAVDTCEVIYTGTAYYAQTICIRVPVTDSVIIVDLTQKDPFHTPRICPEPPYGVLDSVFCIRTDILDAYIASEVSMGRIFDIQQYIGLDTTEVDCDEFVGWGTGQFPYPNTMIIKDTARCRWTAPAITDTIEVWTPAGRDTTIIYNSCLYECPEFRVTCSEGQWDSVQVVVPAFRDSLEIVTLDCSSQWRWYTVPSGIRTTSSPSNDVVFTQGELDSLALVYGNIVDTIGPFLYDHTNFSTFWRFGYVPVLAGLYRIQWNDPMSSTRYQTGLYPYQPRAVPAVSCDVDSMSYVTHRPFTHLRSGSTYDYPETVLRFVWLPQSKLDSLCGEAPAPCTYDIDYHQIYSSICSYDSTMYVYCYTATGAVLIDSVTFEHPILYFWDGHNYPYSQRSDTLRHRVWDGNDTLWQKYWNPSGMHYAVEIRDTCHCYEPSITLSGITKKICNVEFKNLCPDGYQMRWLDDNTIGFYAACGTDEAAVREIVIEFLRKFSDELLYEIHRRDRILYDSVEVLRRELERIEAKLDSCCALVVTDHNSLTGLQGGTTSEYYHLTLNDHGQVAKIGTIDSKVNVHANAIDGIRDTLRMTRDTLAALRDTIDSWRSRIYSAASASSWSISTRSSDFEPEGNVVYMIDATETNVNTNLPDAAANSGAQFILKRIDNSGNTVTIAGLVDGNNDPTIPVGGARRLISDGTNWYFIGTY